MSSADGRSAAVVPSTSAPATATATATAANGAGGGVHINDALFWSRCVALLDNWRSAGKAWHGAAGTAAVESLLLLTGSGDSEESYSRLIASQLWLFGYEIPDSAIAFHAAADGAAGGGSAGSRSSSILILTSSKKCKILQPLAASQHRPAHISLQLLEHSKADRNEANFAQLIDGLQKGGASGASEAGKGHRVGVVPSKSSEAAVSAAFLPRLSAVEGVELVDVSGGWGSLLSVHDAAARSCLERAADLTTRVMKKYLVSEMETIIDEAKQQSQQTLADSTEDVIRNPAKIAITALGPKDNEVKLSADDADSCYTPIIQSGGQGEGSEYDLKVSAASPSLPLQYDSETSIIVQLGARYRNLCSNIGRTYFINPTPAQKDVYLLLTQIYLQCKQSIRPGNKLSAVMLNAKRVIQQSKHAALEDKFTKNCGFGIGFEFRDGALLLTDKNPRVIQAGMAFNLAIGFTDLTTASGKKYAVFLADTILVRATDCESLTKMPREYKDVTYLLGGDADGADDGAAAAGDDADSEYASGARATRGSAARAESESAKNTAESKAMAAHQAELARKQREIALRKLAAVEADGQFNSGLDEQQGQIQAYASPAAFPAQARKERIHVDHVAEALLLPIYDQLVPFHINTVKNVHRQEEGAQGATSLRITFFTPDAKLTQAQQTLGLGNPNAAGGATAAAGGQPHSAASVLALRYISELTYRSNTGSLDKVFYDIKELRKRVQNRMKELEAKQSLVVQADLTLDRRGPVPTLKDIQVRPQLSRKKTTGALTAHVNGLRFLTSDKFKVDILYSNLKAAFYQPAEDTHQVLLHFELIHPILLDKSKTKKTNFLQVYFEVVDTSEDINSTNRYRDEDGLMEEQQERQRRRKWNEKFLTFVKEVEKKLVASHSTSEPQPKIEFDIPYRELKFTGVPGKSSVDIMPTVHSLVALDDTPPLVLPLNEVEIAVFERVQFGLRNFDLVFVYKDFQRLPMRIDSIPMKYLEPIKHWLNSCDLVYYESNQNLLWKAVMKHINSDVEEFWRQGGWSFLADQDDDEAGGGEGAEGGEDGEGGRAPAEESESEFELSSEEGEDDDSEEYETASSEEEDEDEEEDSAADDSDEEGEDWDELENKAKKDDKSRRDKAKEKGERDFSDEDDDDDNARGREVQGAKKKPKPAAAKPPQQASARPKPADMARKAIR